MASGPQYGSIIFGGFFVGVWLYLCLFRTPLSSDIQIGPWILLGVLGLVLAGGIYASRITQGNAKVAIFVVEGVAIAFLAMAFLLQQLTEGLAALITFVGASLIVTALPVPHHQPRTT
jgi:hypothetical protein